MNVKVLRPRSYFTTPTDILVASSPRAESDDNVTALVLVVAGDPGVDQDPGEGEWTDRETTLVPL